MVTPKGNHEFEWIHFRPLNINGPGDWANGTLPVIMFKTEGPNGLAQCVIRLGCDNGTVSTTKSEVATKSNDKGSCGKFRILLWGVEYRRNVLWHPCIVNVSHMLD